MAIPFSILRFRAQEGQRPRWVIMSIQHRPLMLPIRPALRQEARQMIVALKNRSGFS
jgi:hypothetical protein